MKFKTLVNPATQMVSVLFCDEERHQVVDLDISVSDAEQLEREPRAARRRARS